MRFGGAVVLLPPGGGMPPEFLSALPYSGWIKKTGFQWRDRYSVFRIATFRV